MGTERERRQTIGRGLRLCVNQEGERLRGFDVNTLTVIATESYEQFAENLQKEIEEDTGIRFGIVEKHQFAGFPVTMRREDDGAGRAAVGSDLEAPEGRRLRRRQGQGAGPLRQALKDDTLHASRTVRRPSSRRSRKFCASSPAGWRSRTPTSGEQIKTRQAVLHSDEFQGALGPHQAQDHLPRAVSTTRSW